jgi:hypothetical protein
MIQFPRRSVTRFFIPLVDVMILLFSMFMLMPIVQRAGGGGEGSIEDLAEKNRLLQEQRDQLADQLGRLKTLPGDVNRLQEELKQLQKEKKKVFQGLAVHVLSVEPATGTLIYHERGQPPTPIVIDSAKAAAAMVRRHRREAGSSDLYYVIMYPRVNSIQPTQRMLANYNEWLQDVSFGFDVAEAKSK